MEHWLGEFDNDLNSWLLQELQEDYDQDYTTSYYSNSFHHEMMSQGNNNSQVRPENGVSSVAKTPMRSRRVSSSNLVKRRWSDEEDRTLVKLVKDHGTKNWTSIAQKLDGRNAKQCNERWQNHLHPDIKKDSWSEEEEKMFIEEHKKLGNRWSEIARRIPGRTQNDVKNHWHTARRRAISNKKKKGSTEEYLPKPSSFLQDDIMNNQFDANKTTITTIPPNPISESSPPPLEVEYESFSSFVNEPSTSEELLFMLNLFTGTHYQPLGLLPP